VSGLLYIYMEDGGVLGIRHRVRASLDSAVVEACHGLVHSL